MNLIVAADRNWAIGKGGDLIYSIPEDMKYFRRMTQGKTVVMGRKTLESFPGGKPLPKRVNVVLSSNPDYAPEDTVSVHDYAELFSEIAKYPEDDVMLIGGGEIGELSQKIYDTVTGIQLGKITDPFGWRVVID